MHEASIAMGILETIAQECKRHDCRTVQAVQLKIGRAAGILPDSLLFAFEIAKAETVAAAASLEIEMVPLGGTCSQCGQDFETDDPFLLECPHCQAPGPPISRGYEMQIISMEVD